MIETVASQPGGPQGAGGYRDVTIYAYILFFRCLDLYFGCMDLYFGVRTCMLVSGLDL